MHINVHIRIDASEEKLMSARDCLEKYVMTRVFASAWSGVRQESRDSHLSRRIKALRFLRPEVSNYWYICTFHVSLLVNNVLYLLIISYSLFIFYFNLI